ncbi:MAG: ABC transporter substrate-binding protein/permease [Trichlorobacter sp.]|uniref:ABC transporter substrate-binding protein/permease n=1 Tax=Trichlorobacter sp. TaxID=2911007 RepID=UPI0025683915|nr:ABC transporter substrate-binding protein/permease [Trichlorobacter sp.]MDK9717763.1 ABC transporter substrate-binding protein/permease [Trichlorobacter sp.]
MKKILLTTVSLLLMLCVAGCHKTEKSITRLDDAKTAKIGVMTGTTGEEITKTRFPNAQVKSFDDVMDAVAALKSGQLEAIVTALPTAVQVSKVNSEFTTLAEPLDNEDTAIALRKADSQLLTDLNRIIAELKSDGTLASMRKRWLKPDTSPYEELKLVTPSAGKPLKIGVSATREPLSFVDKDGRVTGHDGELARLISIKLNRPIEFSNMKFMALIPALQSGKVDIILSGMTATEERKKAVNFTQPYFANAQVMLVKKSSQAVKSTAIPASLAELKDKRICVLNGSAGDLAARKNFPTAQFQTFTAAADAALAIKANKADAFIYDKSVLLNLVEKNPELMIIDKPVAKLEVAAAIKKENTQLLAEINKALQDLKTEGALQRLRQKWVDAKYRETPALPAISMTAANGVLKMGTCANLEPFSFQSNGKLTGLDIELSQLIGKQLGKKIEIVDMNFEALIPALQSGKIDFALSNFNVTEERKKLILFSLPYIENDISALVRRSDNAVAGSSQPQPAQDGGTESKLRSADDLKDKRIGVLLGSVHDTYATKQYPQATILQYKSPPDLVLAVKSGKVDAAFYTHETLLEVLRHDPALALLGKPLFSVPIGVGFNKANDAQRTQFNTFLRQIKENGLFKDMVTRWILQGSTQMPKIEGTKANGRLIIGIVSDKGMPFTIIKDNTMIGFDVELAERFAAYLGKEPVFTDMEFGSLIAAASTNKIDTIFSTLVITDERKKQVAFSEPYYELGASVFALRKNIDDAASASDAQKPAAPSFLSGIVSSFQSNIIQVKRYLLIWDGLKTTVIISIFATLFGTLLGALVCFMRMAKNNLLTVPAKIYIAILRGMPVLVLLMLIFYVVFASVNINPVIVAVIAFGMNFAAYSAEIFRTGIDGVEKGQTEAGVSLGFTKTSTFFHIVLPQMVRRILPVYKGEFISLVKMTSIVGYIAVQDLTKASDIIRSRTFDAFFPLVMVAILYFLISWTLMQFLEYLERITDPKFKKRKVANQ